MKRTVRNVSLFLTAALFLSGGITRAEDAITVKEVKYAGLADIIKKNKGKVIVVDLWGLW
jgi:hypothetical protein